MSEDNVEVAKRAVEAYNRRDFGAIDDLFIPEFEASSTLFDGAGGVQGREGFDTYARDARDTWEEIRVVAEEIRDLGDGVLILGRMEARGRGSGVPVNTPLGMVYDFRDGKISRLRTYFDYGEALRAAGLAE